MRTVGSDSGIRPLGKSSVKPAILEPPEIPETIILATLGPDYRKTTAGRIPVFSTHIERQPVKTPKAKECMVHSFAFAVFKGKEIGISHDERSMEDLKGGYNLVSSFARAGYFVNSPEKGPSLEPIPD